MTDDERRTEIEAVRAVPREYPDLSHPDEAYVRLADVRAALDRVRDARSDECRDGKHEWAVSGDPATTCVRCGVPWAARSPQGEDHEARDARRDELVAELVALRAAVVEHRKHHPNLTSNADTQLWWKAGL